ncbi:hypothetical protein H072_8464 [Dactylellina haptotyla CBS 200.50]|uniref:Uncharacterized protein n=1 Tax=Dactylellina haptotyla (strain CBS 200.50) TaxID=1284197 RepID=S8BRB9_DACHA|nr:hypothetical protein H072_8464 [Dactylellina haptotyla CBS 200.50]
MSERTGSAAAAAAAIRRQSFNNLRSLESTKLTSFPGTPIRSTQSSRAPSMRFGIPTRASELRSIREDDDFMTSTNYPMRSRVPPRRPASVMSARPTLGVARSASVKHHRRGSQTFLHRTQSMKNPGESAYSEQPFQLENKPGFLPASSRPGSMPISPMLRTMRDPDALGTRRPSAFGRHGRLPITLRLSIFEKAKDLGRRVSQTFRGSRRTRPKLPLQQIHSDTKHYGYESYPTVSELSYTEDSHYADTVVYNPIWENNSYVTTLDHQDTEYFPHTPVSDIRSVATDLPARINVIEPTEEAPEQTHLRGFTPFQHPTDLNGVDSRRVYSALMKSLAKRFTTEPPQGTIPEEPHDPHTSRVSNENIRPPSLKASIEKSLETRKPLSEIAPRLTNTVVVEEDPSTEPLTPSIIVGLKGVNIRNDDPDDSIFSHVENQYNVWQDETTDASAADAALAALKQLSISNIENSGEDAALCAAEYAKLVQLYHDRTGTSTPDIQILGPVGRLQKNKVKEGGGEVEGETAKMKREAIDPAFL